MKYLIYLYSILLILINVSTAQNDWNWQHPLPQGNTLSFVRTFGVDSVMAFGNPGTLMRSINAGQDWDIQNYVSGVNFFQDIHFYNDFIGWAVGDSGRVNKTTNGGLTWRESYEVNDTTLYSQYNAVFFIDSTTGWVAGNSNNISKTTDGGQTWTHYPFSPTTTVNSLFFINDSTGWAAGSVRIYHTSDGGLTWTLQNSGVYTVHDIFFASVDSGWAVGSTELIMRTTDGGANWIEVQNFTDWFTLHQVRFWDANNGIAVGDYGKMLKTNDGGLSWSYIDVGTNSDFKAVSVENSQNIWVVGRSGLILHSTDGAQTWTEKSSMVTHNILSQIQFLDENNGWAAGTSILNTSDGGVTWTKTDTFNHSIRTFQFLDAQTGFFVESQSGIIHHTNDAGISWDSLEIGGGIPPFDQFQFIDANTGWVLDAVDSVYKTIDGGQNWTVVSTDDSSSYFGQDIFFTDINNGWIAGTNGTILHTSDGGVNWISQNSGTSNHLYSIKFADANTGWAGGNDILLKTTDSGATWNIISNSNTPSVYDLEIIDSNTLWILGSLDSYNFPWQSTDGGTTWHSEEIPSTAATDLFLLNDQTGWVVTTQGGIIKRTGSPTSVIDQAHQEIPNNFKLNQNFPNPFNPITKIQYKITQSVKVKIEIFNSLGQNISTLVNSKQQAGDYSINWDGSNMATGVYYYRLKAGDFVQTKRMMLLR